MCLKRAVAKLILSSKMLSDQCKIGNATLVLRLLQPHVNNFARMFLVQVLGSRPYSPHFARSRLAILVPMAYGKWC